MAKLPRITSVPFGSGGTTDDFETFGSTAVGGTNYSKDIAAIQATATWLTGWRAALIASKAPLLQDLNGKMLVDSYMLSYLMQAGVAEWDAATTYYIGSLVTKPGTSQVFASLVDTNTGSALPSAPASNANWQFISGMIGTNYVDSRVTGWINESSLTTTGFGTLGGPALVTRRVGDSLEGTFFFKAGTLVSTQASLLVPRSLSVDTAKLVGDNRSPVGFFNNSESGSGAVWVQNQGGVLHVNSASPTLILFAAYAGTTASNNTYVANLATDFAQNNGQVSGRFTIPIVGWA